MNFITGVVYDGYLATLELLISLPLVLVGAFMLSILVTYMSKVSSKFGAWDGLSVSLLHMDRFATCAPIWAKCCLDTFVGL